MFRQIFVLAFVVALAASARFPPLDKDTQELILKEFPLNADPSISETENPQSKFFLPFFKPFWIPLPFLDQYVKPPAGDSAAPPPADGDAPPPDGDVPPPDAPDDEDE